MPLSIHPMLVHFPIALLFASVFFDVASTILRRESLRDGAYWLLGLGLMGGIAAAIAGTQAEEAAEKAGVSETLIETHETLALVTLGIMAILFVFRLAQRNRFTPKVGVLYLAVAACGLAAIGATGHTGGDLVYQYGAGVKVGSQPRSGIAPIIQAN